MTKSLDDEGFGRERPNVSALAVPAALGALLLVIAIFRSMVIIPAGYVGVRDLFGNVSDRPLPAGLHLINPLSRVHKMSVRTQEIKESASVPSKEGLVLQLEASLLYSLKPEKAAEVYRTVGPVFEEVVVIPQLRSTIRGVTSGYEAKALYTSERELISDEIKKLLAPLLEIRGITMENVLLRNIALPPVLGAAIEKKLEAEQQSEQMKFVLEKERREADRKRIEAQGIADFQAIVTRGLNDSFLRWKGIEATKDLANSPNAKIVVIGSGKDGLPIILGDK